MRKPETSIVLGPLMGFNLKVNRIDHILVTVSVAGHECRLVEASGLALM